MPRFIELAVTVYDDDGHPDVAHADDQWVNLDLVERINGLVTDNLFHLADGDAQFFPYLVLAMASGDELVVTLGTYPDDAAAWTALERFLPLVIGPSIPEDVHPTR